MANTGPRKRLPKKLAVINADNCTGCEACMEVCPVDCIGLVTHQRGVVPQAERWCEVDLERCIGCELCVHIPQEKSNPYQLTLCPWDAIEMVPIEDLVQVVAQIGGPPDYVRDHGDRRVGVARALANSPADA
jgi:electron transport complex protein RnfB